jgi:hypothetical protein
MYVLWTKSTLFQSIAFFCDRKLCHRVIRGLFFKGQKFQSLKMTPLRWLKMLGTDCPVMWRHIPEEWNPQLHCCENLKTCTLFVTTHIRTTQNTIPFHNDNHYNELNEHNQSFACSVVTTGN